MTIPDFAVIGAPRAGTTSLYRYLQEHPGVYMSPHKEPSFFACGEAAAALLETDLPLADPAVLARSVLTWSDYRALFSAAAPDQRTGEASPTYLYTEHAPAVLAHHTPDARVVVSLRQPVERAFSHLSVARGGAPVTAADLRTALAGEVDHPPSILVDKDDYLRPGQYGRHLSRWLDTFGADRVHVIRYEALDTDPLATLGALFAFIGVDAAYRPDVSVRYNQSGSFSPLSVTGVTHRFLPVARRLTARLPAGAVHRLAKLRARVRGAERSAEALDPGVRAELTEKYYADDLARLAELTGDDYADWLA